MSERTYSGFPGFPGPKPDAETLAAQILRELENANSYEAGEGVDVDACKVLLSGLVALVEQLRTSREHERLARENDSAFIDSYRDRAEKAEALVEKLRHDLANSLKE